MIVKLVIPVTVTLVKGKDSSSNAASSFQSQWIRSFPRCEHEKESVVESWQVLEIVPMIISKHSDQIVIARYLSNPDIVEHLVLAANCLFSIADQGETQETDYDYFAENYLEHVWLVVYCRKCLSVFLVCGF